MYILCKTLHVYIMFFIKLVLYLSLTKSFAYAWANCIYTHSVPVPAKPSVDYTIVCSITVQNERYIVSNYLDLNGDKVGDSDLVEFNISSDLISTYTVSAADVTCEKCHKTYATPDNLERHEKEVHEGIKRACIECGIWRKKFV